MKQWFHFNEHSQRSHPCVQDTGRLPTSWCLHTWTQKVQYPSLSVSCPPTWFQLTRDSFLKLPELLGYWLSRFVLYHVALERDAPVLPLSITLLHTHTPPLFLSFLFDAIPFFNWQATRPTIPYFACRGEFQGQRPIFGNAPRTHIGLC